MRKVPVSVIIPVYNEKRNLQRCLSSVKWADEVFVVDSQSTDGTAEVAEREGAEVVQFYFNGNWPKKKNWALENLDMRNEWVFLLDADEKLPPEAGHEFMEICSSNERGFDGYLINRRFMFMGKWLTHAYYPNWNLRLFRHRLGRFECITDLPTGSGDVEIHEHVVLRGSTGRLLSEMEHYAFPTVRQFVEKHNRYSNWEARIEASGRTGRNSCDPAKSAGRPANRRIKKLSKKMPFRPFLRFLYVYLFQLGFLDGIEGYYFARLHGFYEMLCLAKAYEMRRRSDADKAGE